MNIGLVTNWFDSGAGMVSRAYRDVLKARHNVLVYARGQTYAKGDPNWDGDFVTWGALVSGYGSTGIHWREFKRWVRANHIDLVLFNEQQDWPPVVFARRETDALLAGYVDYYTSKTAPFFGLFDVVLCNTQRHYSVFKDHPGASYIPWGADPSVFKGGLEPVSPGSVTFFHSAGWDPARKQTALALEAFRGLEGDCRFVLHIQAPLSKHPNVEALIRGDSRIEVVQQTVPPPGLFHRGDVYVYPTVLEGIGLSIPEALACGLPVITTDSPPMSEFVRDGENGRLVKPCEYRGRYDGYYWAESYVRAEDVREAMRYYVDRRADLGELKRRARASAEERLDWRKNAAGLADLLDAAVRRGRRKEDLSALEAEALRQTYLKTWRRPLRSLLVEAGGFFGNRAAEWLIFK